MSPIFLVFVLLSTYFRSLVKCVFVFLIIYSATTQGIAAENIFSGSFDKFAQEINDLEELNTNLKKAAQETDEQKKWELLKLPEIIKAATGGVSVNLGGTTLRTISSNIVRVPRGTKNFFNGQYYDEVTKEQYHTSEWYYSSVPNAERLACLVEAVSEIKKAAAVIKADGIPGPYSAYLLGIDMSQCGEAYVQKGDSPVYGRTCAEIIKNSHFTEDKLIDELLIHGQRSSVSAPSEHKSKLPLPHERIQIKAVLRPNGECKVTPKAEIVQLWKEEHRIRVMQSDAKRREQENAKKEVEAEKRAFDRLLKMSEDPSTQSTEDENTTSTM